MCNTKTKYTLSFFAEIIDFQIDMNGFKVYNYRCIFKRYLYQNPVLKCPKGGFLFSGDCFCFYRRNIAIV